VHEVVRALGADHVIDSRGGDIAAEVLRLTGGAGADLVLESVGGVTLDASLAATKRVTGRVVVYGVAGDWKRGPPWASWPCCPEQAMTPSGGPPRFPEGPRRGYGCHRRCGGAARQYSGTAGGPTLRAGTLAQITIPDCRTGLLPAVLSL
jgi:hypothetical protein